jgi:hypothetical protein
MTGITLGAHRSHLIQTDHTTARRWLGIERFDRPLFSAKAGSTRSPNQVSCLRQRRPSWSRISSIGCAASQSLCARAGKRPTDPRSRRQTAARGSWLRECRSDHGGRLLGRDTSAGGLSGTVLEGFQSFRIETADALAHGLTIKTDPGCNRRGALAALGAPDDLGPLHALGRSGV